MLRATILIALTTIFCVGYRDILFSRRSLLRKIKIIPVPTAIFAILALATVNGFRGESEPPSVSVSTNDALASTASIAPAEPVPVQPLSPQDAASACIEQAMSEAEASDDIVAKTWLSSVEGYIDETPSQITVQLAVGPRAGPAKGPQCRSEARLTCSIKGSDVSPLSPIQMTGAKIAC